MRVERFRVDDLDRFPNFGGQETLVSEIPREQVAALTKEGNHFSIFAGDGIVACVGFVPASKWRAMVWSLLQEGKPHLFAAVHVIIRRLIAEQTWPRIECYVDPTSAAAVRWVTLLRFQCETPFKPYYLSDGRPGSEWVYLKREG